MKWLDHLEEIFITALIGVATLIIFIAVVHRYASGLPLGAFQDFLLSIHMSWAQELCIILFVWMAKFGAAYGVRQGIHVGVDVLVNRLNPDNRRRMTTVALSAGILFTGIVAILGARMVWENGLAYVALNALGMDAGSHYEGPTTPDLEWPTWIVYLAVPLGSSLMSFRFMQVLANFWRTGDLPHHDHGHVEGLDDVEPFPIVEQKP
ncbi:TRAP transporter small permease [Thiothrix fructosivorans]|uniref:TRAP transporter small permease protein n=1 Tax=Thiothrix fructosivorans TaxID=111770 RepID=A0A8B0SLS2_9GAMM|nr:TRAP transporter small permease [Thiothrix fructosivorans]MBO0612693.1 TRAP transporter small permease [Thiothrix fructosivorans]QTX11839.1 TRAP transporter small permease [Thiothrix fructosivorans]